MRAPSKVKRALTHIFRKKYKPGLKEITFTRKELTETIEELGIPSRNPAHIPYEASKRGGMPKEIIEAGFNTILNKKEAYALVYIENNVIEFPESKPIIYASKIKPSLMKHIIPNGLAKADEQTMLSIINKHKILEHFLGLEIQHYVPHRRCSLPNIGQVEIDQIAWGIQNNDDDVVIPIEAKGGKENLTRSQMKNCVYYAQANHPGVKIRPVAIKLFPGNDIGVVETDLETNPIKFGRFRIE